MYPIEITNSTKRFKGVIAVDDLSLTIPEGANYGFIGPNGSGKTTTLRMIFRILHPDSGQIRVLGAESFGAANEIIANCRLDSRHQPPRTAGPARFGVDDGRPQVAR
jgi:ABC-type multidrug transport system ATPase subunit